jgi:hypoxanthine-DNA glycosylase
MVRPRRPALRGFPPVLDARVETLILGSFPSVASLAAGQYYAHPRNAFWLILGEILQEPLPTLPYADRLPRLLAHRIGLWDVYGACDRTGSLDADIRNARDNDCVALRRLAPRLARIVFNGATAGRFAIRLHAAGFATVIAPSTSPAHAGRTYAQKLTQWRMALRPADRTARLRPLRPGPPSV